MCPLVFFWWAPGRIDVNTGERLVRIDRHLSEYFIFQTLWVLFKSRFTHRQRRANGAFDAQTLLEAWQDLPANIVRPERNKRQHLSSVLARNEINRDYAYNRALFMRFTIGWYQFNPKLAVRRRVAGDEQWLPIYAALNLPLINEFSLPERPEHRGWEQVCYAIDRYLALGGLDPRTTAIAAERAVARAEALEAARIAEERALRERQQAARAAAARQPVMWGTPEARRQEVERLRRQIEDRKKR